jgi:hypothetical protein
MSHCTVCEEPLPATTSERGFRTHFECRPTVAAVVGGRAGDVASCGCGKRYTKRFDGGRETCLDCWRAKKRATMPADQRRGAVAECGCGIRFAKRFDGGNETCLPCFKRKRAAEMVEAMTAPGAAERYNCICPRCGRFPVASRDPSACIECLMAESQ